MSKQFVITGGSGYIGSHTALLLLKRGHKVNIIDRSDRLKTILSPLQEKFAQNLTLFQGDLADQTLMSEVLTGADAVIHCAGSKSVFLSLQNPIEYFENNITNTLILLKTMNRVGVKNIVFCSTSSMYKSVNGTIHEASELDSDTPYSYSKLVCERILADLCQSNPQWRALSLRFFNPLGYDQLFWSKRDEFDASAVMPQMILAAENQRPFVLMGDDYDTEDGSTLRDFVHINDLSEAIALSVEKIEQMPNANTILNIGTGKTISMKQLLTAFQTHLSKYGVAFKFKQGGRRPGDIVFSQSDSSKARKLLQWSPNLNLQHMIESSWYDS